MQNFFRGLTLGVFALTTVEYFRKYNLLDTLKDLVAKYTHVSETVALVVVLAVFAGLFYVAYR